MELIRFELLLPAFGLILARVAGLVLSVPMLASGEIPRMVKIILCATLALMMFPVVAPTLPKTLTLGQAAAGCVGEFVVGEVLGLGAGLIFFAAQIAGQVVSYQSGITLGQVFNPLLEEESSVLDQVWYFAAMIFFMALRGHVAVAQVLLGSFRKVPPMMVTTDGATGEFAAGILKSIFEMALRLSGPTILALLLASLIMGFLTKTMPQLNIMTVGFSLKIGVALAMVALTISLSEGVMTDGVFDGLDRVGALLDHMSGKVANAG